jgi:hypothetical protein
VTFGTSRELEIPFPTYPQYEFIGETAQPRVKLTRLRLWGFGAIFSCLVSGKIRLRLQNRRAAYAHVSPSKINYAKNDAKTHRRP